MLPIFDGLRDLTFEGVAVRILLAVLCGGAVGLERTFKRRPAGFRTHILICIGAALTVMTSQYLLLVLHCYTDPARLGAQVIAGVGFIGAGTIVVTRRQHVKGLTTAAGLWCSAIVGLTLGMGYYEGGLLGTGMILVAEVVFAKLEYWMTDSAPEVNLYIEYQTKACLNEMLNLYRKQNLKLLDMELTRRTEGGDGGNCVLFTLRLNRGYSMDQLLLSLNGIDGVCVLNVL